MTAPRPSNDRNGAPFDGFAEPRQSRGLLIASIVLAVAIVALVAAALVWIFTARGESSPHADEPDFAVTTNEEASASGQHTETSVGSSTRAESGNTTVTETVERTASSGPMNGEGADRAGSPFVSGVPASAQVVPECDGRGVLIVQSVMGNSGDVAGEINAALANNPGAVVYPPGVCPSIRGEVGGAAIYAVVQDFGTDYDALCSAEATAGGDENALNARRLDRSTNWHSPC